MSGSHSVTWLDSKSGNDTFISVYGHASNSTSVTPGSDLHGGVHTYDDMVFTTNGTERFYVDNSGWIEFSAANNSIRLPRGTTLRDHTTLTVDIDQAQYVSILTRTSWNCC